MKSSKNVNACKRWKMLADVLTKKVASTNVSELSVRRFSSFELLKTEKVENDDGTDFSWFRYSCHDCHNLNVDIRQFVNLITSNDLFGFDNTGNVCVWPSEEIMTHYCVKNKSLFRHKKVLELGGGMTSLAGIFVAASTDVGEIILTDGNERAVQNINAIISKNKDKFGDTNVSSRIMIWDKNATIPDLQNSIDIIICADCLFFDKCREDLVMTMLMLLKDDGKVLCFAPTRGQTMNLFIEIAENFFNITRVEEYDEKVSELHSTMMTKGKEVYDQDLHYPILLELTKNNSFTNKS